MSTEVETLCCCEYIDIKQERNHILACCCNCQDFDEAADSILSGKNISSQNKTGLLATCLDRLRIPWPGGAKKVSSQTALHVLLVIAIILIAAINTFWTITSAIGTTALLVYVQCRYSYPARANFFYRWTMTSFIILYLVFQILVIPLLEILWEENAFLSILIGIAYFSFREAKQKTIPVQNITTTCPICQLLIPPGTCHSLWIDFCVGPHNCKFYLLGSLFTCASSVYGANLTLTCVCNPKYVFGILIPEDCTDAYYIEQTSISFTSAIYALGVAIFIFCNTISTLLKYLCKK